MKGKRTNIDFEKHEVKLIKIKNDYYLVDNTEIQKGDWFYNPHLKEIHPSTHPPYISDMLKIISSTFRDAYGQIPTGLDLQEVKELIGEVDVEKKAFEYTSVSQAHRRGFIDGYNQALEDNKEKKYTEFDLHNLLRARRQLYSHTDANVVRDFIQSLQSKTEWEVECETIDNRELCNCSCHNNPNTIHFVACCNDGWIGKITQKLKLK